MKTGDLLTALDAVGRLSRATYAEPRGSTSVDPYVVNRHPRITLRLCSRPDGIKEHLSSEPESSFSL